MDPTRLDRIEMTSGPRAFSSFVFSGWAETGPTHGPHGHWPCPATMLIILVTACKMNYECNDHKGRGRKKKKKRERDYLAQRRGATGGVPSGWHG